MQIMLITFCIQKLTLKKIIIIFYHFKNIQSFTKYIRCKDPPCLGQGESTHTLVFMVKTQKLDNFCFYNFDIKFGFKSINP
jgi:hypothetical protein